MDEDLIKNEPIRKISQIDDNKNRKNKKNQKKTNSTGGKYEVRPLESQERERFEPELTKEHYKSRYNEKELGEINKIQFDANPPKSYKGKYEKGVVTKDVYNGRYSSDGKKPESHAIEGSSFETYNGRYSADSPENESDTDKRIRGIKKLPETQPEKQKKKPKKNKKTKSETEVKNKKSDNPEQVRKKRKKNKNKKKNRISVRDFAVNVLSISASIVLTGFMILNMPILKSDDGNTSIINFVKNFQPLVQVEGELRHNTMDLQINNEIVDVDFSDGLDLPQLVEGQYSVLFLGFDEEEFNTDVIWVCQFDIGHNALNILQIPRDTCLPDYTSSPTGKFNSIYAMGERYITPPIQRVVNAVQENFGIPIDAYITTGCHDIVDMVNLVGGIPISLDEEIMYEADKRIPAGDTILSGEQAEWFVRFRWALA
ncbi:MAG: LCP family protein, partial [Ruminococcus sp.]|nr:LCP family protein [Ruminococcus sp.]